MNIAVSSNERYPLGQFFVSGGYLQLIPFTVMLVAQMRGADIVDRPCTPYVMVVVIGSLLLLHAYLFRKLPRKPYVVLGAICWALTVIVQIMCGITACNC